MLEISNKYLKLSFLEYKNKNMNINNDTFIFWFREKDALNFKTQKMLKLTFLCFNLKNFVHKVLKCKFSITLLDISYFNVGASFFGLLISKLFGTILNFRLDDL